MGYSVYVKTDKDTKKKIYDFLDLHMRNINEELFGIEDQYYDLSTDFFEAKDAVGFHYNANSIERTYIFTIIKWLSSKLNKDHYWVEIHKIPLKSIDIEDQIKEVTQRYKELSINIGKEANDQKAKENAYFELFGIASESDIKKAKEFINKEIERLDGLWKRSDM